MTGFLMVCYIFNDLRSLFWIVLFLVLTCRWKWCRKDRGF